LRRPRFEQIEAQTTPCPPESGARVNTRTIAILALVIAVVLLIIFLF
jgi:hypothetical protein